MTVGETGEFELIGLLAEVLPPSGGKLGLGARLVMGIGDDCAAVSPSEGMLQLLTTDTMVQGVHFLPDADPAALGWKSLASNLSDIAAMGGLPTAALVTLGLPPEVELEWLKAWYGGLGECALAHAVEIAGGDIVRQPDCLTVTIALTGEVEPDRICTRAGARPGDIVAVTGTPGQRAAAIQLHLAGAPTTPELWSLHLHPEPRIVEARAASAAGGLQAMIDLSDGLGGDLRHICERSRVGALIRMQSLPISAALESAAVALGRDSGDLALSGGEDYELLMCIASDRFEGAREAVERCGRTTLTAVGTITDQSGVVELLHSNGTKLSMPLGFRHF